MEAFWILLIVGLVLYTLISGLRAIIITWHNCMARGSADNFFSDIWNGTGGNVFVILGLLLLCLPVYLLLLLRISMKKKKLSYRAETRYVNNPNYRQAFDMIKTGLENGEDLDAVKDSASQFLLNQHEPVTDVEESIAYYSLLLILQNSSSSSN